MRELQDYKGCGQDAQTGWSIAVQRIAGFGRQDLKRLDLKGDEDGGRAAVLTKSIPRMVDRLLILTGRLIAYPIWVASCHHTARRCNRNIQGLGCNPLKRNRRRVSPHIEPSGLFRVR